jgi:hypothetical protein
LAEVERVVEERALCPGRNRRLSELAHVADGARIPFLCECADLACLGRLEASLSEFEVVQEDEARFFLLPGHRRILGERILAENGRFEVVSKTLGPPQQSPRPLWNAAARRLYSDPGFQAVPT